MQEEDIKLMIGTCLSMFIRERSKIKFIYRTCKSEIHSNN